MFMRINIGDACHPSCRELSAHFPVNTQLNGLFGDRLGMILTTSHFALFAKLPGHPDFTLGTPKIIGHDLHSLSNLAGFAAV